MGGDHDGRPETTGSSGPDLVWTKLVPPTLRPGLISRAGLQSLLQAGLEGKLCLLDGPAGSGKTTLVAQWHAAAGGGRVAWVSLDEGDNDPTRFWTYLVEALRTVEPDPGSLPRQLGQAGRALGPAPRRRATVGTP
jgi:LuxR family transcriptional regulator, maltose regulon positive regulatory protein